MKRTRSLDLPLVAWIALIAVFLQHLLFLPTFYRKTIATWFHLSNAGRGIGLHDSMFLPAMIVGLVNFFALPICAIRLAGSQRAGESAFDTKFRNGLAALCAASVFLIFA